MYKGKRKINKINLQGMKLTQTRCQNLYVLTIDHSFLDSHGDWGVHLEGMEVDK
jgi:hypothetical protein